MSSQRDDGDVSGVAEPQHGRREFLLAALAAGTAGAAGSVLAPANSVQAASPGACTYKAPLQEVEGKVAIITGGNKGIGLGIALACLNAGMKTAITYRNKASLDETMQQLSRFGDRVHTIPIDVTDAASVDAAAEETVRKFGKVHLLVANAGVGVLTPVSSPESRKYWKQAWDVNVNGVYNCVQSFLPKIQAHGEGGQIVATSSVEGLFASKMMGVYSTVKAAIVTMMEALHAELDDKNIGVSAFCPGFVNSSPSDLDRPAGAPAFTAPPEAGAMDLVQAGQLALEGIRANRLFILTHPEYRGIKDRSDALIASIPRTPVPPARLKFEANYLTSDIYAKEIERLRCPSGRRS